MVWILPHYVPCFNMISFKSYLLEGARLGHLYHYTRGDIMDFIEKGSFELSKLYDDVESERTHGYSYFLSCSRLPRGGYNFDMDKDHIHTIFQLNANNLSYHHKIIPVRASSDDSSYIKYPTDRSKDENEDRVLSKKPTIPLKSNVVKINMYIPHSKRKELDPLIRNFVYPFCMRFRIGLCLYNNIHDLGVLDERKAEIIV